MSESPEPTWLTQEAFDRLAAELDDRSTSRRTEITRRIEAAREEGDLRENGGYHAAKDEQGKNEARIRQLTALLQTAQVGAPDVAEGEAAHGMVVSVDFVSGTRTMTFLLGSREEAAHASVDVISPSSPMGAAVLGHRVGETVEYLTPAGKQLAVRITEVQRYTP